MTTVPTNTNCLYEALANIDILFKQNYTCCMSCGHDEIDEYRKWYHIGFAFFHMQETDHASTTGEVHLCYGTFNEKLATTRDIADMICEVAKEVGFNVEWDGSTTKKIALKDLDKEYYKELHDTAYYTSDWGSSSEEEEEILSENEESSSGTETQDPKRRKIAY